MNKIISLKELRQTIKKLVAEAVLTRDFGEAYEQDENEPQEDEIDEK